MIGTDTPHAGRSHKTWARSSVAAIALVSSLALAACGSDSTSPASGGGTGGSLVALGTGGAVGTGGKAGTGGSGPASSGGSTGSADGGTDSGTAAGPPCDATTKVFIPKCSVSCHGSSGPFMPDLSSEKAVAGLVGMPQIMKCAADMTSSIVNTSAPLGGSLFLWITGATCRDQMPYGGPALTAEEIACVKSYFAAKIK